MLRFDPDVTLTCQACSLLDVLEFLVVAKAVGEGVAGGSLGIREGCGLTPIHHVLCLQWAGHA
jgi:hypothetical protein